MRFRRVDIFAAALSVFLVAYAGIRAARLPITIDEAITYRFFITAPVTEILFPDLGNPKSVAETPGVAANNHVLNSLLAKASKTIFGTSELALRLPNVLSLAAYLLFSWLLLRSLRSWWAAITGFVLLALNPFLLDYFSMARGYGLSIGLMMAALYLIQRSIIAPSVRDESLGLLLLGLGALASFVLIDVLLAVAMAVSAFRALRIFSRPGPTVPSRLRRFAFESVPLLSIGILLMVSVGLTVLGLTRIRGLWFGGRAGFWSDTVSSLVETTLYTAPYAGATRSILTGMVAIVAILVVLRTVITILRRPIRRADSIAAAWSLLALVTMTATVAEHRLFGTPFRIARAALYFIPLFVLAAFTTANAVTYSKGWRRTMLGGATGAVAIAAVVHFAICANFSRFLYFVYDMDTPRLLADLEKRKTTFSHPVRVRTDWKIAPGLEFYRSTLNLWWITWDTQSNDWNQFDCAYLQPEHSGELAAHGFRIVRSYPLSGNLLGESADVRRSR